MVNRRRVGAEGRRIGGLRRGKEGERRRGGDKEI